MKSLIIVASALLLGACAGAPMVQTSFDGYGLQSAPTRIDDPRMQRPQFYMNDEDGMAWTRAAGPRDNR